MALIRCEEAHDLLMGGNAQFLHCIETGSPATERITEAKFFQLSVPYKPDKETGIPHEDKVLICYEVNGLTLASIVWWGLQSLGRKQTVVLEGGLIEWKAKGFETIPTQTPEFVSNLSLGNQFSVTHFLDLSQLPRPLSPHLQLIDTSGNESEAIFFDPSLLLSSATSLETPQVMLDVLELSSVSMSEDVLTVATGHLACLLLLQLRTLGKVNVSLGLRKADIEDRSPGEEDLFYSMIEAESPTLAFFSMLETAPSGRKDTVFHDCLPSAVPGVEKSAITREEALLKKSEDAKVPHEATESKLEKLSSHAYIALPDEVLRSSVHSNAKTKIGRTSTCFGCQLF